MKSLLSEKNEGIGKIYKMYRIGDIRNAKNIGYDIKNITVEIDDKIHVKIESIENVDVLNFEGKFLIEVVGVGIKNKNMLAVSLSNMYFDKKDENYFYFEGDFDKNSFCEIISYGE